MLQINTFVSKAFLIALSPVLLTEMPIVTMPDSARAAPVKTISFSGYTWEVREQGVSGPGPNQWDPRNVRVDKEGRLHLKISRIKGAKGDEWRCAELTSENKFGFGQYEFQTEGSIDRFDRNIVLGLFDYPVAGEDPDGTNEIDIEFARWGKPQYPNGNFTIYPSEGARGKEDSNVFEYALPHSSPKSIATHRFTRTRKQVSLATFAGEGKAGDKSLAHWTYAPAEQRLIPQKPLAVHINLWLFDGKAPSDSKEIEVVIKKFTFTPSP